MAAHPILTNQVREALAHLPVVDEKKMFMGVCFMVNDKMCVCVGPHYLLCRIGRQQAALELAQDNCSQMTNNGRVMKDFVYVEDTELTSPQKLGYWIDLCLRFNGEAKSSRKKTRAIS